MAGSDVAALPRGRAQRHLVEGDAGGDADVERLGVAVDGDADDDVAALPHQPGQPGALGADHQRDRVGEAVVVVQVDVAVAGQPTVCSPASWYEPSARARLTARATGIRAAAPALVRQADAVMPTARRCGHDDAVRVERRRRADDGTEVARIGDAVERDQQRRAAGVAGQVEQVVGVRVLVRRHLQADALVQRALGHPVELGLAHLEQRQPAVRGERQGLGDPLVGQCAGCHR